MFLQFLVKWHIVGLWLNCDKFVFWLLATVSTHTTTMSKTNDAADMPLHFKIECLCRIESRRVTSIRYYCLTVKEGFFLLQGLLGLMKIGHMDTAVGAINMWELKWLIDSTRLKKLVNYHFAESKLHFLYFAAANHWFPCSVSHGRLLWHTMPGSAQSLFHLELLAS